MTCITTASPICTIVKLKKDVLKLLDNVNRKVTIMRNDEMKYPMKIECESKQSVEEVVECCGSHVLVLGTAVITDHNFTWDEVKYCFSHISRTIDHEDFTKDDNRMWDEMINSLKAKESEECMC